MIEQLSIHGFIQKYGIKTETGEPLSFKDHLFLFDPYRDESPKLAVMKAAQIGFSTLAILKTFWIAKNRRRDIIYTLPTQEDVTVFAGGKINRLISQNPILSEWVHAGDKDRVEQKSVGESIIYYRGTSNPKQAISHSSDLNVYDEVDASNPQVIDQYATRLQASDYKGEWFFSHPSAPGFGVHKYWEKSDQKHWFIKCSGCEKEQFLSWPESIDESREVFQCKNCHKELTREERRVGRWRRKNPGAEYSGYWISLLMCPWVSAKEILKYYREKPADYFYNKVLGLPYAGAGNKLTWEQLSKNLTSEVITPDTDERVVIGIDTGEKLDYVIGTNKGLFFHGDTPNYDELDRLMVRWPRAIAVVDGGGDMVATRAFQAKYPGRVFLCFLRGSDRKTAEIVSWGKGDEHGVANADRNRLIQLVVDEFAAGRIPLQGTENDWYDYWLDWNNLTRTRIDDPITFAFREFKWVRNGRDHRALATAFWRVGMMRFSDTGALHFGSTNRPLPTAPEVRPDGTISLKDLMSQEEQPTDWRDV